MDTVKAGTKLESYAIISGIAGGYAAAHAAATFLSPITGAVIELSAAAVFLIFWRFFEKNSEGMELAVLVNLRGLGGVLVGLIAGGIGTYKILMVDSGLAIAALVISLLFFRLVKRGGES